jgi:hypothetical protein
LLDEPDTFAVYRESREEVASRLDLPYDRSVRLLHQTPPPPERHEVDWSGFTDDKARRLRKEIERTLAKPSYDDVDYRKLMRLRLEQDAPYVRGRGWDGRHIDEILDAEYAWPAPYRRDVDANLSASEGMVASIRAFNAAIDIIEEEEDPFRRAYLIFWLTFTQQIRVPILRPPHSDSELAETLELGDTPPEVFVADLSGWEYEDRPGSRYFRPLPFSPLERDGVHWHYETELNSYPDEPDAWSRDVHATYHPALRASRKTA